MSVECMHTVCILMTGRTAILHNAKQLLTRPQVELMQASCLPVGGLVH
jgi:hypothetical protein